ncbi:MAG TPA: nuclear transport factor 2 family protein [Acidimicrobiia bacterium]|nr:nuclear transport factor 2 family protein [Acidimicrobiia bacterium]
MPGPGATRQRDAGVRDEDAVAALVVEYASRLDAGDLDGVAALFAHGAFRSPAGTNLVGAEAVRRLYDPVIRYADGTPRTKHVLGNLDVTVDHSAATATARCAFVVLQAVPGFPLQPVLSGRYHDSFAKVDGEWCYLERMVLPDLNGDLSRHMAGTDRA